MKRWLNIVSGVIILFLLLLGGVFYTAIAVWTSNITAEVEIPRGASVRTIGQILHEEKVIRTPTLFAAWAKLTGNEVKLQAGLYRFATGMTLHQVLNAIESGRAKFFSFTIVEGSTIDDIARSLSQQEFVSTPQFVGRFRELAKDPEYVQTLGLEGAKTLEGYLFAETYKFLKPMRAEDLLEIFVQQYRRTLTTQMMERANMLGLSVHNLLTFASIVEKETGDPLERPIIASVFLNRLRKGMRLQSDPTVIYGLQHYDGNIRKHDLSDPHSYNTYVHKGLPPGPICSVGHEAIEAVLNPAESDYLYFVSMNNGTHKFSRTLSEHAQAVREYQLRR